MATPKKTPMNSMGLDGFQPRVVPHPPTCVGLEEAILERFEFVEKVRVRDNLVVSDDRLLLVTAVLRRRPAGTRPHVEIAIFASAQLDGWMPKLPWMRVLCSTYDLDTGEIDS